MVLESPWKDMRHVGFVLAHVNWFVKFVFGDSYYYLMFFTTNVILERGNGHTDNSKKEKRAPTG